jgi:hypothetical protein
MTLSIHDVVELGLLLLAVGGFLATAKSYFKVSAKTIESLEAMTEKIHDLDKRVTVLEEKPPRKRIRHG